MQEVDQKFRHTLTVLQSALLLTMEPGFCRGKHDQAAHTKSEGRVPVLCDHTEGVQASSILHSDASLQQRYEMSCRMRHSRPIWMRAFDMLLYSFALVYLCCILGSVEFRAQL